MQKEYTGFIECLRNDKDKLEKRNEDLVGGSIETAAASAKRIAQLEKDIAVVQEKLTQSELQKTQLQAYLENEARQYEERLNLLKEDDIKGCKGLALENERLKSKLELLEHDFDNIASEYEKDKALWQDKFVFLEGQRNQAKADFADVQRKFELTLVHMQKQKNHSKESSDHSSALLSSVDTRYQMQVQELKEAHARHVHELEERIKCLESDLKSLKERHNLESCDSANGKAFIDEKLQEFKENESRLIQEIKVLKEDRERKAVEHQMALQNEKALVSKRVSQLERMLNDKESKKAELIFEYEKQNAEWHLERDHLLIERTDLQNEVFKLDKKKEFVTKENERLKSELNYRSVSSLYSKSLNPSVGSNAPYSSRKYKTLDRPFANIQEPLDKIEGKFTIMVCYLLYF